MSHAAPDAKPGLGVVLGRWDVIVTAIVLLVSAKVCTGFVQWWTCTCTRLHPVTLGYTWLYMIQLHFGILCH